MSNRTRRRGEKRERLRRASETVSAGVSSSNFKTSAPSAPSFSAACSSASSMKNSTSPVISTTDGDRSKAGTASVEKSAFTPAESIFAREPLARDDDRDDFPKSEFVHGAEVGRCVKGAPRWID